MGLLLLWDSSTETDIGSLMALDMSSCNLRKIRQCEHGCARKMQDLHHSWTKWTLGTFKSVWLILSAPKTCSLKEYLLKHEIFQKRSAQTYHQHQLPLWVNEVHRHEYINSLLSYCNPFKYIFVLQTIHTCLLKRQYTQVRRNCVANRYIYCYKASTTVGTSSHVLHQINSRRVNQV